MKVVSLDSINDGGKSPKILDEKILFLWLMQHFDGKARFLLFCYPLKLCMILYSTGTVFFYCSIVA
jgi:hypothetical protein